MAKNWHTAQKNEINFWPIQKEESPEVDKKIKKEKIVMEEFLIVMSKQILNLKFQHII